MTTFEYTVYHWTLRENLSSILAFGLDKDSWVARTPGKRSTGSGRQVCLRIFLPHGHGINWSEDGKSKWQRRLWDHRVPPEHIREMSTREVDAAFLYSLAWRVRDENQANQRRG
jgi:hypothetical protein